MEGEVYGTRIDEYEKRECVTAPIRPRVRSGDDEEAGVSHVTGVLRFPFVMLLLSS